MPQSFHWRALYPDGAFLDEYDDATPDGHGFKHIDLPRCIGIVLLPQVAGLHQHSVTVDPARNQRPIFFRRHTIGLQADGTEVRGVVHVLGWQKTVQGENVASFVFAFDDGSVLLSDDIDAV